MSMNDPEVLEEQQKQENKVAEVVQESQNYVPISEVQVPAIFASGETHTIE